MKKFTVLMALVLMAAFVAMANPASAWDSQKQHFFPAPDGTVVGHNLSKDTHLVGTDTWQTSTTITPPAGMQVSRTDESYSKSVTAPVLDPKCNNFKYNLTSKTVENRKTVKFDQPKTSVVGTNSGGNPSLVNVSVPALLYGFGSNVSGVFGGWGANEAGNIINDVSANLKGGNVANDNVFVPTNTNAQLQAQGQQLVQKKGSPDHQQKCEPPRHDQPKCDDRGKNKGHDKGHKN